MGDKIINLDERVSLAEDLARRGRIREAERHLTEIIKQDPHHVGALLLYGDVLLATNQFKAAAEQYSRFIEIVPNNAIVRINYGNALFQMEKTKEAANEYLVALKIEPDNLLAHHNLGVARNRMGLHNDETWNSLKRAWLGNSHDLRAGFELVDSLAKAGFYKEAFAHADFFLAKAEAYDDKSAYTHMQKYLTNLRANGFSPDHPRVVM